MSGDSSFSFFKFHIVALPTTPDTKYYRRPSRSALLRRCLRSEAMSFFTLKVHAIGLTDLLVDKLIFLDDTLPSLPYETSCHLRTT